MDNHYYAVVMAGGGGTRLWPLSRRSRPKQMLPLITDQSLFQSSIGRLLDLFPPDRIYVVTVEDQAASGGVSPELLALLVCPLDKQALRVDGSSLVCTACGRVYPVEDGIPNMLVEDDQE